MLPSFNPSPDLAAKILDSVTDPTLTLRDVADLHHTTVEALVLWFAEPEIAERLDHIESTIARRTRIVAFNFLPAATIALGRSIDEHNADEAHFPVRSGDQRGLELRRRSRETARRAAALLLRLANFTPGPRRATDTRPASPPPSAPPPQRQSTTPPQPAPAPASRLLDGSPCSPSPSAATPSHIEAPPPTAPAPSISHTPMHASRDTADILARAFSVSAPPRAPHSSARPLTPSRRTPRQPRTLDSIKILTRSTTGS
ncbi:MAG: hypothetical protein KF745_08005 [Phycisphaeraceae bacterium]|nr:hypothetical protein [Phycisphaeraceae bacterium]